MPGFVQRAAREPDRLAFESEVVSREGASVELAETYFFAESGGQPSDRGTIAERPVRAVRIEGDRILHDLDTSDEIAVGDTVRAQVDPSFRRYCRRAHTASHVLYGAARRTVDGLGYGGFEIDDRKVRLDFESTVPIDDERMIRLERLANEAVWESRSVGWEQRPRQEAVESDEIAFNLATEDVFAETETVRIVDIEGWDRAACGGTHVRNTCEIGPIILLDRSNPGSGLTRIEFAVGPDAIAHLAGVHGAALRAATQANAPPEEIDEATTALQDRLAAHRDRIESLERQLVAARLSSFDEYDTDGFTWRVGLLPAVESEVASDALHDAVDRDGVALMVALTGDERTAMTVASDGTVGAADVVDLLTGDLGGGGGGSATLAQGGGIPRAPGDVSTILPGVIEELVG